MKRKGGKKGKNLSYKRVVVSVMAEILAFINEISVSEKEVKTDMPYHANVSINNFLMEDGKKYILTMRCFNSII